MVGLIIDSDSAGQIVLELAASGAEGDLAGISIELRETTWNGYPVTDDGFADTGAFMGKVFVEQAPWVYSYAFGKWFYLPDGTSDPDGAWAFFPN